MVLCLSLENGLGAQATTTAQSQLDELSARAAEAQRRDDYQQAAKVYQEILKLRPDLTGARLNLGLMQFSLKDYSAAIQTFEAVLHQNPKVLPANLFLARSVAASLAKTAGGGRIFNARSESRPSQRENVGGAWPGELNPAGLWAGQQLVF